MNTYKITVKGSTAGGIVTPTVEVKATAPGLAVKRALDGRAWRHPILTVRDRTVPMRKGDTLALVIERIA